MRPWKLMLGLGAACAACCAVPLLAAAGGLSAVSAVAAALWACADELIPAALGLGAVAALGAGGWWLWRQRLSRRRQCACTGACATGVGQVND